MRFNGRDVRSVHPALSIAREIPPGTAKRSIHTIGGTAGEIVTDVVLEGAQYKAEINIAARTQAEAWRVRALLAGWASSKEPKLLEPTHWPGMGYKAILSSISAPEFSPRFATVELVFLIPESVAHSIVPTIRAGAGGMHVLIGGTEECRPVITQTMAAGADGLTISMDGEAILTITGALAAGQKIVMDTENESVTIDGESAMARINWSATRWRGFTPGAHDMASTDGGALEMRWHDRWV